MGEAFLSYGVKLIVFSVIAFLGICTGIKLRKAKDKKEEIKNVDEVKGNEHNE
mgnify:CR=1 FL=1